MSASTPHTLRSLLRSRVSRRQAEWLTIAASLCFWALIFYQWNQPASEPEIGGDGALLRSTVFKIAGLIQLGVFPAIGVALWRREGLEPRGPRFVIAQMLCWSFPFVMVCVIALLILAALLGFGVTA